jgi:thiamine kinase-like enzyme
VYDRDLYRTWITRAIRRLSSSNAPTRAPAVLVLSRLERRYDVVIERLMALPPTFVHGDFYPSNVLLVEDAGSGRVAPVDWEMASIGPGLLDLAALIAGTWSEEQKRELARAYHSALSYGEPFEYFLETLDYCRLHVAVQWLGWAAGWSPPAEHLYDWLEEALRLSTRLGL